MGSYSGGAYRGYYLTANISQGTNDSANNRTYCYANITLTAQQNYFAGWAGSGSFQVNGGVVQYWGGNYSMPGNYTTITLGSWEGWIGHDSNGNGTISVFSDFDTANTYSYLPDYVSVSASEGLPNYDRRPAAPSSVTPVLNADRSITVTSNAVSSPASTAQYYIQWAQSTNGGSTYGSWSTEEALGATRFKTYAINVLAPGNTYKWRMRASNNDTTVNGGYSAYTESAALFYPSSGKRFDGSTFQQMNTAKRFDGSGWVDLSTAKRFDGTSWITLS